MITNANNIKFRCSSLGALMTDPKDKSEPISETAKEELISVYVRERYGRFEELKSKYLDKGNAREEDAISLLTLTHKKFYRKNSIRITNQYVSGEHDIHVGDLKIEVSGDGSQFVISPAEETFDTKCSWSMNTFMSVRKSTKLDKNYKWQGMGYMFLTGAKKHTVAYCLVNSTDKLLTDEKKRLAFQMGVLDIEPPEYIEKCRQLERNHIFDLKAFLTEYPYFALHNDPNEWKWDVPMEDRIWMMELMRSETDIAAIKRRVMECRAWMNQHLFKIK